MHQTPKLKCLAVAFAQSIEARCQIENEDVAEAAPTGNAPTTSEWSTSLLPTKVRIISEVWRYSCSSYLRKREWRSTLTWLQRFLLHHGVMFRVISIFDFQMMPFFNYFCQSNVALTMVPHRSYFVQVSLAFSKYINNIGVFALMLLTGINWKPASHIFLLHEISQTNFGFRIWSGNQIHVKCGMQLFNHGMYSTSLCMKHLSNLGCNGKYTSSEALWIQNY